MRTRLISSAAVAVAVAAMLGGCASADPVVDLDPAPADAAVPAEVTGAFTTALTEVSAHFLDAEEPTTDIVSDGATVDVAVTEIAAALPIEGQALAFVAATAFELSRTDADVVEVELVASAPVVAGEHDGGLVATIDVTELLTPATGPITESRVTYALTSDGTELTGVGAWEPGLDSGVGLDSPTGAAQRFVDLALDGDVTALERFSAGANTATEVAVLAAALDGVDVVWVELPQERSGTTHVVYAVDDGARVLARFEVDDADRVTVVYSPTA
jgi:hypothetical protein